MKKLFFAALPFLIASCSEKTSEDTSSLSGNAGKKFTLEVVDTLFIDSGEEIILIENQDARTDSSDDHNYYFNYNRKQNLIDVINLNTLKLNKQIPFETEGPNGTSSNVSSIDHFGHGNFMINNFNGWIQIFNNQSQKTDHFRLDQKTLKGDTLAGAETISTYGLINDQGNTFYSFYGDHVNNHKGIAKINIIDRSLIKIPVEGLEAINDYQISLEENGHNSFVSANFNFQFINEKIILTNSVINEAFVYDIQKDSLFHQNYISSLSLNKQKKPSKTVASSYEEFKSLMKELNNRVYFEQPIYDSTKHLFYRLTLTKENISQTQWTYVLTIFDENLKMITENVIPDFEGLSSTSFVKNGKIYFKHNINDELAFVVMEVKEVQ